MNRENEFKVEVAERQELADGVVALVLHRPGGGAMPSWEPGAHIDLVLDTDLERQYSLCGDPGDLTCWRVAVLREPAGRGGSARVHDAVSAGDLLTVRGPRNHFALEPAPRYLFVAGGIGITPILPMLGAATAAGADWHLLYGGRRTESMAYLPELVPYGAERVTVWPEDTHGRLPLDDVLSRVAPETLVYCCGPESLLVAVEQRCATLPPGSLHVERFAPKVIEAPVALDRFRVRLAKSDIEVEIGPDDTILDVLEEADADVVSSCREGTCGTCETAVVSGRPDHRDSVLTAEEQAQGRSMMICVSRSRDPELVLDI